VQKRGSFTSAKNGTICHQEQPTAQRGASLPQRSQYFLKVLFELSFLFDVTRFSIYFKSSSEGKFLEVISVEIVQIWKFKCNFKNSLTPLCLPSVHHASKRDKTTRDISINHIKMHSTRRRDKLLDLIFKKTIVHLKLLYLKVVTFASRVMCIFGCDTA
jgi:hypothetical protein